MAQNTDPPITTSIGDFCRLTGISRSKTYELLAAGEIESIKIGRRRLIVIDSYRKLIDHQRANGLITPGEFGPTAESVL